MSKSTSWFREWQVMICYIHTFTYLSRLILLRMGHKTVRFILVTNIFAMEWRDSYEIQRTTRRGTMPFKNLSTFQIWNVLLILVTKRTIQVQILGQIHILKTSKMFRVCAICNMHTCLSDFLLSKLLAIFCEEFLNYFFQWFTSATEPSSEARECRD